MTISLTKIHEIEGQYPSLAKELRFFQSASTNKPKEKGFLRKVYEAIIEGQAMRAKMMLKNRMEYWLDL